ncbi:MAG TPA: DUF4258 domain-containing protein, partial [Pyrinomonadaceae bacterium]|nr:DUF4258 domain-containing protein [Pyrinomonadaceae bacterium]
MSAERELLEEVKRLIHSRQYRVRIHAIRHMVEEGFDESDLLEAVAGRSRILEHYPDEGRCLLLGYFRLSGKVRSPLHVVCDYSNEGLIDIVTAYIPQRPWWDTPT